MLADGAPSLTYYQLAEAYPCGASAVDIRLGTGRTHQIRVHLGHIGCPLLGDSYYRDPAWDNTELAIRLRGVIARQALHAKRLGFRHPVTGEAMTLEAELPPDLKELEAVLSRLPRMEPSPAAGTTANESDEIEFEGA